MRQMVLNLPFRNAYHLCQLIGREPSADQQLDHPPADGALGQQHGHMVSEKRMKHQFEEEAVRSTERMADEVKGNG